MSSLNHDVVVLFCSIITTSNSTPWHGFAFLRCGSSSTHFSRMVLWFYFDPAHLHSQEKCLEVPFPAIIQEVQAFHIVSEFDLTITTRRESVPILYFLFNVLSLFKHAMGTSHHYLWGRGLNLGKQTFWLKIENWKYD